jgi:RNA polymerase sigma-70 factor, ECF subfamily
VEREFERQLVARLQAGDAAAFDAVYEAYRPRLFSFLARLSRRRDVAEDLLDETWLRLVACAPRLADDTCLVAWLFTVARNLHTSWRRHRALDEDRLVEAPAVWPDPAPGQSPFDAAACDETERRLERALSSLPLRDREALLMVTAGEMTAAGAAAALGLSPAALRKRVQRARERLASAMELESAPVRTKAG